MNETKKYTVLVGGTTGKQGGAVTQLLLEHGHRVIAYVQPGTENSPKAQELATKGVKLAIGDLADAKALAAAANGVDAIFSVTIPFGPKGKAGEVEQGKALVDVAADHNVYLIYSSIAGIFRESNDTKVVHANSKREIEEYMATKNFRHTIIAPSYLMENALNFDFNSLKRNVFALPLSPNRKIDQTTVLDIAGMAVYALEHPDQMIGERVEIASENISGEEIAQVLSNPLSQPIPYVQLQIDQVRRMAGDEIATMFQRFEDNPYHIDIAALHAAYPEVRWHTFKEWAQTYNWKELLHKPGDTT